MKKAIALVVAAPLLLIGYAISAVLVAIPIYFVAALLRGDLSVIPKEAFELRVFVGIAGTALLATLIGLPGRIASKA